MTSVVQRAEQDNALHPRMGQEEEPNRSDRSARVGLALGPVVAVVAYVLLPDGEGGLSSGGRATAAVGLLMAVWWVTEALPLPVTSLLPLVLFPVFGVLSIDDAAAPYANDLIFLFLGGFMLALAMQRWGLHRRIALVVVRAVGTKPSRMVGGFMLATAFLSMWVSNTATAVMMLPVGVSVLALALDPEGKGDAEDLTGGDASNLATALMLGIAYAASIGSLATLIGTPPNVFLAAFISESYDITLGFGQWMLVGLPLAVVFLAIAWFVLVKVMFRPGDQAIEGGREFLDDELEKMGPMNRGEKVVGVVFVLTALAWVFRDVYTGLLEGLLPGIAGLSDAGIAVASGVVLVMLPVDWRRGVFALDWDTAKQLPWGVLLLFGGGLSLAAAVGENGVDVFVGQQVEGLSSIPTVVLVLVVAVTVLLLTELTSNTATAAALLPIMAGAAVGLGASPLLLAIPAALAASCAFMLPVATPPNAIVFGSGHVTIGQMVRGGALLNAAGVVLITAAVYALAVPVFGLAL